MPIDIILCDIDHAMVREWRGVFRGISDVEVIHGSILDVSGDAYVSPANGFGIMDGGIDAVLSRRFPFVEEQVQTAIAARGRPLAVGECVIVETADFDVPYLICAPTMRVPSNVAMTDNAYTAMKALLHEVDRFNADADLRIETVVIPGLCTGVGSMPPNVAAEQMARAFREWMSSPPSEPGRP